MMRLIVDMILIFESAIALYLEDVIALFSQITKGVIGFYLEDAIGLFFRKCDRPDFPK